jgi:S1-C subfamily serine protease
MGFVDKQILPSGDVDLIDGYSRTVADAVERVGPAVSRVGRAGHGSGFAISQGGLIVTNNHVLEDGQRVGIAGFASSAQYGHAVARRDQPQRTWQPKTTVMES